MILFSKLTFSKTSFTNTVRVSNSLDPDQLTLKKGAPAVLEIRSRVRSTKRTASQFPGRGPLMWMMPLHLHINQKLDSDDDVQILLGLIWV